MTPGLSSGGDSTATKVFCYSITSLPLILCTVDFMLTHAPDFRDIPVEVVRVSGAEDREVLPRLRISGGLCGVGMYDTSYR